MKQKLMMIAMALAGGMIALGSYRIFFDNQNEMSWDSASGLPVYNANYAPLPVDGSIDFTVAAERTVNSVVHVKTQTTVPTMYNPWMDFFGYQQQDQVQMGSGSGVIISQDGYIITNNHVVEGAEKLQVTLNNNKNYEATVVGRDPSTDIAVIKIDEKALPAVQWGNSEDVRIGQWVIAVGNPFDLTSTVTAGIVSAKARNINLLGGGQQGQTTEEIFPVESFIQTDAAVNPGNSGGALVNTRGELVGINTAIASRSGVFSGYSFAVPSSIAQKVARDLIEFGHVQRAFIGVQIGDVTQEQAKELGLKEVSGVYVRSLTEGGAAADSGIKEGDVIQKVGETAVKNVPELQEQVSKHRPGDKIKVTVWRDSKTQVVEVTLRNRSGKAQLDDFKASAEESYQSLGATFVAPSSEELSSLRIGGGAKISDIQNGKFKSLGMQRGFIITRIGDKKINSPEELKAALAGKEGTYVEVRGMYANGMEAMYGFKL
ncbi:MAG: trypsin-like peptidase domain-containing protein [Flavobacteriales bacterium]